MNNGYTHITRYLLEFKALFYPTSRPARPADDPICSSEAAFRKITQLRQYRHINNFELPSKHNKRIATIGKAGRRRLGPRAILPRGSGNRQQAPARRPWSSAGSLAGSWHPAPVERNADSLACGTRQTLLLRAIELPAQLGSSYKSRKRTRYRSIGDSTSMSGCRAAVSPGRKRMSAVRARVHAAHGDELPGLRKGRQNLSMEAPIVLRGHEAGQLTHVSPRFLGSEQVVSRFIA